MLEKCFHRRLLLLFVGILAEESEHGIEDKGMRTAKLICKVLLALLTLLMLQLLRNEKALDANRISIPQQPAP